MISRKATERSDGCGGRSDAGNPSYLPEGRQPRAQDGGGSTAGLASPVGASQRAVATGPPGRQRRAAPTAGPARASAQKESRAGCAPEKHTVGGPGDAKHRAVSRSEHGRR